MKCGNANPKGNIQLTYKGGCKKELKLKDAYRCVGCGGYFHKECILKHFELEKDHDYGRQKERNRIIREIETLKEADKEDYNLDLPDKYLKNETYNEILDNIKK